MKFPLCNREAEGSARSKTSFFLKRRGPLVPKCHFSWSGGVRSPQNVVFLEAEGSARPKTSFFLKRRGPLVSKRHFSWSGGVRLSKNVVFLQAIISTRPCERPKGAWQSRLFFWWLTSYILRSRRALACHFLSPIQIILVFLKGKTTTIRRDESLPRATFRLCDVTSCYEEVFYPQCRNSESFFKRKVKKLHKSRKITFPALHLTWK